MALDFDAAPATGSDTVRTDLSPWQLHLNRVLDQVLACGKRREQALRTGEEGPPPAPVTPAPEHLNPPTRDPLSDLIRHFELTLEEADLLRLTLACELDSDVAEGMQQLRGERRARRPSLELALEIVAPDIIARRFLLPLLHEGASLRRHHLITLHAPWHKTQALLMEHELVAPPELLFHVSQQKVRASDGSMSPSFSPALPLANQLYSVAWRRPRTAASPASAAPPAPGARLEHLFLPPATREGIQRLLALTPASDETLTEPGLTRLGPAEVSRLLLLLQGPSGTGRRTLATLLADQWQLDTLTIDLRRLGPGHPGIHRLALALREARRLRCLPLLMHADSLSQDGDASPNPPRNASEDSDAAGAQRQVSPGRLLWPDRLAELLAEFPGPVAMVTEKPLAQLPTAANSPDRTQAPRWAMPLQTVLPEQSDVLLTLWETALAAHDQRLPRTELRELLERYVLSPGQLHAAVAAAYNRAAGRDPLQPAITLNELRQGAADQQSHRLEALARRTRPQVGWEELILPKPLKKQLLMFEGMLRHRETVYETWGLAQRMGSGRGVKGLFTGPSGTGKTMAASVLASRLGLDLFRVNLAALVSKWVGETEKNIDRIFREARTSRSILLFDEADALFGKRGAVNQSSDRYANMSINYLLQRFDEYDGIVVLTSNFPRAIDDAFSRRLHFMIAFPSPDEGGRLNLWKAKIPEEMPLASDVDLARLAKFELSGGNITNVVVSAAFLAAGKAVEGREVPVSMLDFMRAIRWEHQKLGHLSHASEFEGYFEALDEEVGR